MSRKLQAQRKFAQGAFIPGSNNNLPERRSREEIRNEPKQIYYNNMSAKNLLDVLSFQNMHRHNQPVVLLERLQNTATTGNQQLQNQSTMTLRKRKIVNTNDGKVKKTRPQSPEFTKDDEKPLKCFKTKHTRSSDTAIETESHHLRRNTNRCEGNNASTSKNIHVLSTKRKRGSRSMLSLSKKLHLSKRKPSKCRDKLTSFAATCSPKLRSKGLNDLSHETDVRTETHHPKRNANRFEGCNAKQNANVLPTKKKRHEFITSLKKNPLNKQKPSKSSDNLISPATVCFSKQNITRSKDTNNQLSETVVGTENYRLRRNATRSKVIKRTSKAKKSPLNHSINTSSESISPLKINRNADSEVNHPKRNSNKSKVVKKSRNREEPSSSQKNTTTSAFLEPTDVEPVSNTNLNINSDHSPIYNMVADAQEPFPETGNIIEINDSKNICYYGADGINEWMMNAETSTTTTSGSKDANHFLVPLPPQQACDQPSMELRTHDRDNEESSEQVSVHHVSKRHAQEQLPREEQTLEPHTYRREALEQQAKELGHASRPQLAHEQSTDNQRGHELEVTVPDASISELPIQNIFSHESIVVEDYDESIRIRGKYSPTGVCPSEYLLTLREVLHASKTTLDRRCNICRQCHRVNKVFQITDLMQRTRKPTDKARDVYEADSMTEVSVLSSVPTQRNARCVQTIKPMYLDLLPHDNQHIIEISTAKVPNRPVPLMQARLINKSEVDTTQDLNLVEHENLFDQVLQTLDMSLQVPVTEPVTISSDDVQYIGDDLQIPSSDQQKAHSSKTMMKPSKETLASKASRQKLVQSRKSAEPLPNKSQKSGFPKKSDSSKCADAPIFHPTEAEFSDPITYFEKIMPQAAKFGLCKIVAPPGFKPKCFLGDDIRFTVTNQYIARLYSRWGPAAREMSAIKAYLATQGVKFTRPPLLDGVEMNLPKLYHIVQRYGGLKNVIEKKRWTKVAEELGLTKGTNPEKKLDQIYVRYLLPYDTLSNQERQQTMSDVEKCWNKKNLKMLDRALNPLHRQKILLGESDSSEEESEEESEVSGALAEGEDCVVPGRSMNLTTFKKASSNVMDTHILTSSSSSVTPETVEDVYWHHVLLGTEHVCVNTASIDTGEEGYGFTKNKSDPYGKHPWNLKMLSHNSGNVLRSLGPVLGVTVPTLHVGMVFSTSCWHRDPHGLPWIEYMHTGPGKIWYGIPNEESQNFRQAVETLCPAHCQNKQIWLSSDIIMLPPSLMMEQNVSLSRVVQNPGEFVIVFPKAYSSSICTGYTISESVYFATKSWLSTVTQVFQEVRDSCEPTMFSLEQLLIAAGRDARASRAVIIQIHSVLTTIINNELKDRRALEQLGVQNRPRKMPKKRSAASWNVREQDECEFCRATLYLSKVIGLPDKMSSVCLHHALKLLGTPKHKDQDLSSLVLVCFFTDAELQDIINSVQKRLL